VRKYIRKKERKKCFLSGGHHVKFDTAHQQQQQQQQLSTSTTTLTCACALVLAWCIAANAQTRFLPEVREFNLALFGRLVSAVCGTTQFIPRCNLLARFCSKIRDT